MVLLIYVLFFTSMGLMFDYYFFADPSGFILFPLVVHSFDLVVSSVGILSIRGTRDAGAKVPIEDPMAILQKGYSVTIVLAVITFGMVIPSLDMFNFVSIDDSCTKSYKLP